MTWTAIPAAAVATFLILAILLRQPSALPIDLPNERSLHTQPTPRIGGLALMPGAVIGMLIANGWSIDSLTLLSLAAVLFLLSAIDDRRGLSVGLRFSMHLVVTLLAALWTMGWSFGALLGALVMVWITNLYNFMDGADGLAGGMTVIGFAALGIEATATPALSTLAFALVGAAIAFLLLNFHPAKLFLGDAGSIPLGFLAGGLGLAGFANGQWPLWFPLLIFSPFLADATATLLRRLFRGDPIWVAHREHYYQRLIRMGWSHRRLALAEYLLMLTTAFSALLLLHAGSTARMAGLLVWCLIYSFIMFAVDFRWQRWGRA